MLSRLNKCKTRMTIKCFRYTNTCMTNWLMLESNPKSISWIIKHHCRFVSLSPTHSIHLTKKFHHIATEQMPPKQQFKLPNTILLLAVQSTDSHFSKHQWDDLLPQAEFTLNMLQPTRINPKMLVYTYLYGEHNYNAVPMAPPRWKVLCLDDPTECNTWALHGTEKFYVAPATDNYCHYECFIPTIGCTCISVTILFYPPDTYQQVTQQWSNWEKHWLRLHRIIHYITPIQILKAYSS